MTLLAEVAGASARATETSSRLAKVRELAACLKRLAPEEIEIAIAFLKLDIEAMRRELPLSVFFCIWAHVTRARAAS